MGRVTQSSQIFGLIYSVYVYSLLSINSTHLDAIKMSAEC